jgi:uncharacterized protein YjiS (DUF1127 family)
MAEPPAADLSEEIMSTWTAIRTPPASGTVRANVTMALRWVVRIACAFSGRRVVADLARMDDRMLRDVGLTRSDLRDAVAEPLVNDPTVVLFKRAAERRANRQRQRADAAATNRKPIARYY